MSQTIDTVHERESPEAEDSGKQLRIQIFTVNIPGYTEPESSNGNSTK
jgi:hypothetical protein